MKKQLLYSAVCALTVMCGALAVPAVVLAPSSAQAQADVSFDMFQGELARYGDWVYSDRWGEVWVPDVGPDFRPYDTAGYWADTDDYGWTWVSDYPWGDITFHYGRWVNDPNDGWLWIPGYVWSPAWVVWRSNDRMAGWMPMPPDDRFMSGEFDAGGGRVTFAINFDNDDDYYGYRRWYGPSYDFANLWVFVGYDHFADRDFRRYRAPRNEYRTYINNTRNITNYTITNNVMFNRSIDRSQVERASGRPVARVRGAQIFKRPQFVTRVDQGQRAQQRMRDAIPRGRGTEGSAPRPSQQVVERLSDKIGERRGRPSGNLYTRESIQRAPAQIRPANVPQNAAPQREALRGVGRNGDGTTQPQGEQLPNRDTRSPVPDQQRVQQEQQDRQRAQSDQQREQQQRAQQETQQQEQRRAQQVQQRQQQEQQRAQQTQQRQQQEQQRAQQTQQRQQQEQQGAQQNQQRQQQEQQRAQQNQQRQQQEQQRQAQQQQQQQQQQEQQGQARQSRGDESGGDQGRSGGGRGRDRDN